MMGWSLESRGLESEDGKVAFLEIKPVCQTFSVVEYLGLPPQNTVDAVRRRHHVLPRHSTANFQLFCFRYTTTISFSHLVRHSCDRITLASASSSIGPNRL